MRESNRVRISITCENVRRKDEQILRLNTINKRESTVRESKEMVIP